MVQAIDAGVYLQALDSAGKDSVTWLRKHSIYIRRLDFIG